MKALLYTCNILLLGSASFAEEPQNVPISELGAKFQLVGKLHEPLGRVISIKGVAVEGRFKGYEGGPNLRVQGISRSYTQEDIQIAINPYFRDWGEDPPVAGKKGLPKLEMGQTYEMVGYESGGFVGVPNEAFEHGVEQIQTTDHYFRQVFVVIQAKRIEPITYAPLMFTGRKGLLVGTAKSSEGNSNVFGDGWMVVVERGSTWPDHVEGKQVEMNGLYHPSPKAKNTPDRAPTTFELLDGEWHLIRLEDQLGKKVSLRGTAFSLNKEWWFHYRGTNLYVEGMEKLLGWTNGNHEQAMIMEGRLEQAKLPSLAHSSFQADRDLAECFIIREPSWKPLPALLFPDRPLPSKADR